MLELDGKVAIITGGASGMGRETVKLFHAEGARVVVADIQDDLSHALVNEIGDGVVYCRTDVSKAQQVEAVVNFAVKTFGKLDIMFNNAGITGDMSFTPFLEDEFADFDKLINVDLRGVLYGIKYAGRQMKAQGGGSIINTASTTGFFGGYGILAYRAAKAGVISLTVNSAIELGDCNIRVNAVSPGPIETPIFFSESGLTKEQQQALSKRVMGVMVEAQALKRIGQPIDIANTALFFASDRSVQITGQNISVCGGYTLGDVVNRSIGVTNVIMSAQAGKCNK